MQQDLIVKRWDNLIRTGHAAVVKNELRKVNSKKVLRPMLISYCDIARRVGSPELIIRWLRPIVRSPKPLQMKASQQELAIYALGLLRLNAFRESYALLNKIDRNSEGQVDFYLASFFINQWNYQKAIHYLDRYCRNKKIPNYPKLVGRLNRFACLVSLELFDRAESEFNRLNSILQRKKLTLLLGNLLEIRSQMLVLSGRHEEADELLSQSKMNLKNADYRSVLYVGKWQLILKLFKSKQFDFSKLQQEYLQMRELAQKAKDWETFRELDFYWFKIFDKNGLKKLYWGSRFQSYKQKVEKESKENLKSKTFWIWTSSNENMSPIDPVKLAKQKLIKKLLFLLSQELYSPIPSTELIDMLYTDEYFHPIASHVKFSRLLSRTRRWLRQNCPELKIENFGDSFLLQKSENVAVTIHEKIPSTVDFDSLSSFDENHRFTCKAYAKLIKKSERTARRKLLEMARLKLIKTVKRGPRTYYSRLTF